MPTLFDPLVAGDLHLRNRIVLSPLTRARASVGRVPNDLMATYYSQRAGAGLIVTEATSVTPMGVGYEDTPGIWNIEQIEGWRKITTAVHAKGGIIVLQLWHVGRVSDPSLLDGALPVAPSAIAAPGNVNLLRPVRPFVVPRALETEEIPAIVDAFAEGARNAMLAGFDGVEIHGANGYLLDQFLQTGSNHRTDRYGGSVENRARLLLEVTDACIAEWGASLVGVHLAPRCDAQGMGDANPAETFGYVAKALGERGIAFICAREKPGPDSLGPALKRAFGGVFIANQGFTKELAQEWLDAGDADAVAFGTSFLANPDLPERFATGAPLNEPNPATFYAKGHVGYTDYPALSG